MSERQEHACLCVESKPEGSFFLCLAPPAAPGAEPAWPAGGGDYSTVEFAAGELARYCEAIFGVEFTTGSPAGCPDRGRGTLSCDEYEISCGGGKVILRGGSPRGILFSVYDFLETILGCRWYYPDPKDQLVPSLGPEKLREIMNSNAEYSRSPDFKFREREYQGSGREIENAVREVDWWAKLRMNAFLFNWGVVSGGQDWKILKERVLPEIRKRGLLTGLAEHGAYPLFLPPERYFEKHPEWFCYKEGRRTFDEGSQFCTENREAMETFLANFTAFARENPEFTVYYPAPNDKGGWCECVLCSEKPKGDRYLELNNRIARALSAVNGKISVLHLVYGTHKELPEDGRMRPAPNLILDLALWGRDYSFSIRDEKNPDPPGHRALLENWVEYSRKTSSVLIKHCKFMRQTWLGMRLLPLPAMHEDMKHFRKLGLSGFDFPLASAGVWTKALPAYVIAKKCWDADACSESIVREYFGLYFGPKRGLAEKACRLEMEAFPNNRYAGYRISQGNFSISWGPSFWRPSQLLADEEEPPELVRMWNPGLLGAGKSAYIRAMRQSVEFSVRLLDRALDCARSGMDESAGEYAKRFEKLYTAILQVRLEQEFLRLSAVLAGEAMDYVKTGRSGSLVKAEDAFSRLEETFAGIEKNCIQRNADDGLLWFGMKMLRLGEALPEWRATLEKMKLSAGRPYCPDKPRSTADGSAG